MKVMEMAAAVKVMETTVEVPRAGYRGVTVTMADVAHPLTRRAEHLDAPSRGPDEDSRDGPGGADPYRNGRGVTNLGNSVPLSLRAKSPRSHPYDW